MSPGELIAIGSGLMALAGGVGGVLVWVWKGGSKAKSWDDRIAHFEWIVEDLRTTLRTELGHIAEEVRLLRQTKELQAERLTRTETNVDDLLRWKDRVERNPPAP